MSGTSTPTATLNTPIYIADFSCCTPGSALSTEPKPDHWTLIPYETDQIAGTLLGAGSLAHAPPVTLPLNVNGWHSIFLGIWDPIYAYDGPTLLKLKLTGEAAFRRVSTAACRCANGNSEAYREWQSSVILECPWRQEDLTDKDLIIAQQTKATQRQSYLAYIKLIPLTAQQTQAVLQECQQKKSRVVTVTNDGGSYYMANHCENEEDLLEQVEFLRHSDVGKFMYALTHGDIANYSSRIAPSWTAAMKAKDVTVSTNKKRLLETFESLQARGIDHVKVLLDHIKAMGIEFHSMVRLGALGDLPPSQLWPDGIVDRSPETRILAKDGTPMQKASYAFPQVRQCVTVLIEETLQMYDLDGINLCFSRGPQFVGYEEPVVQEFKKQHNIDPRDLDENDPRLQQLKADYITQFVREVRQLVSRAQKSKSRKIELSAWLCGDANDPEYQLFYNIDIRTWLSERLIDSVIAHKAPDRLLTEFRAADCAFYLYDDTAVTEESIDAYQQGRSQGFVKWDLDVENLDAWALTSRLGHISDARDLLKKPPAMTRVPLKTIGGHDVKHMSNVGAEKRGYWPPELLPIYTGG